ncbi:MAG: nuclear transport factor 2 family protein [Bacteroidetes bacterium]|nr:nuclear transport factor 2 family protein [Bacteroidota bacterium]
MNRIIYTIVGSALLLLVGCSKPSPTAAIDLEAVKVEIQAMEDAFAAAEKAKDFAKVAAYYSDDAISYSRNEEPATGKAAIQDAIAKRIAKETTYNVYKVVDLFAEGDLVVEVGSWEENSPLGEKKINHGHYMSIFKKIDGKYLCIRDMNVTSSPAKP